MKNAPIKNFLSLVKFSHTLFALPFALIGYFIAIKFSAYQFDGILLLKVVLCMVFARSAAMAFNRYIDRDIDSSNERTANVREIPNGKISPRSALIFVIVNAILFVITTYFINDICFYLSPVALIAILGYSLTKRFTALCHLVLGIGLSLAPIGAYLAVVGQFAWLPIYFSIAVLFWVAGFDLIYSLQDEEFDRKMSLHSLPVLLGRKGALFLSKVFHLISASFIVLATLNAEGNYLFWIGTSLFILLLIYQHTLVKSDDLSKVNLAFFTTNGIASVIFSIFVILSLYLS
ncbi:MAG: 4-hydroxybenzoate octaprenyltransferase [Bacteroidetes bacterium]|nr:MAG: 4-hydroxybenzoate octaprenyltransferase [Bacteroidota bacterium]MBL1144952.1 4-hydroxybenzoate octaprenyltransferase [Bacteroidota bacterium]MCB0802170.1 putative 4-hydroxybenzoate polyprenyltransferase [Flavobacteriales bacterium]NOG57746.1 UbiA family prenyltransferase [Bacteroidota bacterium]